MNDNPYDPYDPYKDATGGYSAPGHDPYGYPAAPYGPAPGYGPVSPYPVPAAKPEHEGRATTALILSCVQLVLCCGLTAIPGVVFGAMALGEKYDLDRGEHLTRNAWLSVWINFGVLALGIVLFITLIATDIATS
ncbi:DUF4190 domain-containing protein [Nocardiopsis sp. CC223A]|uniref:DUF4190 domain-containing protein n=1 Tax=Nocardiopsis sp. CC223A TaxID=3044051 RepID=UPI00278BAE2D|nr:DUF4190 domain-containing protein [Nocardiopsis sp. CC223A]